MITYVSQPNQLESGLSPVIFDLESDNPEIKAIYCDISYRLDSGDSYSFLATVEAKIKHGETFFRFDFAKHTQTVLKGYLLDYLDNTIIGLNQNVIIPIDRNNVVAEFKFEFLEKVLNTTTGLIEDGDTDSVEDLKLTTTIPMVDELEDTTDFVLNKNKVGKFLTNWTHEKPIKNSEVEQLSFVTDVEDDIDLELEVYENGSWVNWYRDIELISGNFSLSNMPVGVEQSGLSEDYTGGYRVILMPSEYIRINGVTRPLIVEFEAVTGTGAGHISSIVGRNSSGSIVFQEDFITDSPSGYEYYGIYNSDEAIPTPSGYVGVSNALLSQCVSFEISHFSVGSLSIRNINIQRAENAVTYTPENCHGLVYLTNLFWKPEFEKVRLRLTYYDSVDDETYVLTDYKYLIPQRNCGQRLTWLNARGGYDAYTFEGEFLRERDIQSTLINTPRQTGGSIRTRGKNNLSNKVDERLDFNTQYFNRQVNEWLSEIFLSNDIFWVVNNQFIPIFRTSKKSEIFSNYDMKDIVFRAEISNSEQLRNG